MRPGAGACALVAAGLLFPVAGQAQKAPPKGRTRTIFVSVVDRTGTPVVDLQPGDFDVQEGGAKRTVVRAALAKSPMRVAVMVDTSDAASTSLNPIRAGLAQFFDALPPEHEALLVSTGRQMRMGLRPQSRHARAIDSEAESQNHHIAEHYASLASGTPPHPS